MLFKPYCSRVAKPEPLSPPYPEQPESCCSKTTLTQNAFPAIVIWNKITHNDRKAVNKMFGKFKNYEAFLFAEEYC